MRTQIKTLTSAGMCGFSGTNFIILFTLALIMTGCAPSLSNLAPQLNPIPVRTDNLHPLSFKGVVLRIPLGEEIGHHYDGLAKVSQYALNWQSGISFGSEEFRLSASETLRECGYRVLGGEGLLFGGSDGAKATFQLGATITALKYNTFGSLAGNYNEAVVYADWELYNAVTRDVVYRHSTEGFAKVSPRSKPAVFDAFNNALRNLLAEDALVSILSSRRPKMTEQGAISTIRILAHTNSSNLVLPDSIGKIFESVVTLRVGATIGTGFVISEDGYVLTAAHVVSGVKEAQLHFNSGLVLLGTVLRIDEQQDIALLKIPGTGHKSLSLALDKLAQPGSEIYAVGTPVSEELSLSVSRGVVSGHRERDGVPYLQTDASLNPGNSGGPLLNVAGEVVGIVSWKIVAPGFEGLAFGVPVDAVSRTLGVEFVEDLGL